jgi:predicted CoA-binding protein
MSLITDFLARKAFVVVGASASREKFGNKVLRWYILNNRPVIPVHPSLLEIEGVKCQKSIESAISSFNHDQRDSIGVHFIVPPKVALPYLEECKSLGIKYVWLQPGVESSESVDFGVKNEMKMLHSGPCILRDVYPQSHHL